MASREQIAGFFDPPVYRILNNQRFYGFPMLRTYKGCAIFHPLFMILSFSATGGVLVRALPMPGIIKRSIKSCMYQRIMPHRQRQIRKALPGGIFFV
ncbi:hypothetical protein W822_08310 [Advenella kashmirensis W13003]|uniref:Uncharacterized protein n=1 Tax=Advenella kashmirensis W13003 TaxID=1424334 RepID=V8QVT8_9BURK|nr:hypothetical protein W822_08310 [Advenella kashmirensis W13003]